MIEDKTQGHDPYQALRSRDFRLFLFAVFAGSFGEQMITVALGWELYNRTGSALALGGIGLAQVIPLIVLSLPAGHVADRYDRKRVAVAGQVVLALASVGLALLSAATGPLPLIYACLVAIGSAEAFAGPASSALVAQVIPPELFESGTTWRSSTWQLSAVFGPAAGGFLISFLGAATWVYALNAAAGLVVALALAVLRVRTRQDVATQERPLRSLIEGMNFLRHTPVLLAAITLDLFAVLLGGATALLPIFAKSILHVGPAGLGWLQASTAIGAVTMALALAHRPTFRRAGRTLLIAVTGFGLATIVFGLSRSFLLSMLMLFVLGALDNISVVIRGTLVLVRTPDVMRGRIGAVNALFVGSSNQLGGFESGVVAQLLGPVPAVVLGGLGTIVVVLLVAWRWPEMRRLGSLTETQQAA